MGTHFALAAVRSFLSEQRSAYFKKTYCLMRLKFCSLRQRHSSERPARPRQWRSFTAKVGRVTSALSKWPVATSSKLSCTTCMASWIRGFQVKDSQWKRLPSSQVCQCGRLACCNATRSGCLVSGGTLDAACRNCLEGRAVQFLGSEVIFRPLWLKFLGRKGASFGRKNHQQTHVVIERNEC